MDINAKIADFQICSEIIGQCTGGADGSYGEKFGLPAPIMAAPTTAIGYNGPAIKPN